MARGMNRWRDGQSNPEAKSQALGVGIWMVTAVATFLHFLKWHGQEKESYVAPFSPPHQKFGKALVPTQPRPHIISALLKSEDCKNTSSFTGTHITHAKDFLPVSLQTKQ